MPSNPRSNGVVHLIDDDEAVRQSTAFLLASTGLPVRTYESADLFIGALDSLQAGCIISDIRMPGMDGLSLLRRLRELGNHLPVIIITGHGDVPMAVEAMKAGAIDFIEKPFDDDELISSINAALDYYDNVASREMEVSVIQSRLRALSPREREVLDGLVTGHPNKTIAYDLQLSPRTVEVHRANVMTKMQAGSLSDLVRMVLTAK